MLRFSTLAMPSIASIAVLFGSAAQAMDIQVYDRISVNDQGGYIGVMIGGAEQVLTAAGRADQAAQVEKLFTTVLPGDQISVGMVELELNTSVVRQTDADNLVKNPNARLLQVEIAMIMTLKNNGIVLPRNFMRVGDNFRPKDPLGPPPTFAPPPRR
jgi:hypothetical protein